MTDLRTEDVQADAPDGPKAEPAAEPAVEAQGAPDAAAEASCEAPAPPSPLDGARAAVIEGCERLNQMARASDLDFIHGQLADLRVLVARADPRALTPKRGLAGLFDSPRKRLRRFRDEVIDSAPAVSTAAVKLRDAAAELIRRNGGLNAHHQALRDRLTDLDAALAGFAASDTVLADDRPLAELVQRLDSETRTPHPAPDSLRAAAVGHLPLARLVQNVDARLADAVSGAAEAAAQWRDQMLQALGAEGKKVKPLRKLRPDQGALGETCAALAAVLDRLDAALAATRSRRGDVMARLDRALERARAA